MVGELLEPRVVVGFGARSRDGGLRGVRARTGRVRHRGRGGCKLPAIGDELVTSDGEDTSAVRWSEVRRGEMISIRGREREVQYNIVRARLVTT